MLRQLELEESTSTKRQSHEAMLVSSEIKSKDDMPNSQKKDPLLNSRVRKEFEASWFEGNVVSYNEERNYYFILYDNGDKEEAELGEVEELVQNYIDHHKQSGSEHEVLECGKLNEIDSNPLPGKDVASSRKKARSLAQKSDTPDAFPSSPRKEARSPQSAAQLQSGASNVPLSDLPQESDAPDVPSSDLAQKSDAPDVTPSSPRKAEWQQSDTPDIPSSPLRTKPRQHGEISVPGNGERQHGKISVPGKGDPPTDTSSDPSSEEVHMNKAEGFHARFSKEQKKRQEEMMNAYVKKVLYVELGVDPESMSPPKPGKKQTKRDQRW